MIRTLEAKGLSPASMLGMYRVGTQGFSAAVRDRVIALTPSEGITLPKGVGGDPVPPTIERVSVLTGVIGDRWRAPVVTLAGSGPDRRTA